VNRRELLKTGAACGLLLALPLGCQQTLRLHDWNTLAKWTTGLNTDQVKALGKSAAALQAAPQWRGELPDLPMVNWLQEGAGSAAGPESLKHALGSESRQQFASNQSVILDGWVISRLEAALCALAVT